MDNRLQELTEKIYSEGVLKAEEEGKEILEKAKKEAGGIIEKARIEAARIIEEAEKNSKEIRTNVKAELKLTTSQAISAVKQRIANMIMLEIVEKPVKEAFNDKIFIQGLIDMLIKNWKNASGEQGMHLWIPEKEKEELGAWLKQKYQQILGKELKVFFDDEHQAGFKIGPQDGSYKISFTDQDFSNFLKTYLRPKTNELLYGGE